MEPTQSRSSLPRAALRSLACGVWVVCSGGREDEEMLLRRAGLERRGRGICFCLCRAAAQG